jgi:hypothetical protein
LVWFVLLWFGLVCLMTVRAREMVNAKLDAMFAKGGNSQDVAKKEQVALYFYNRVPVM